VAFALTAALFCTVAWIFAGLAALTMPSWMA
jgi:hypothetical protein